MNTIWNSKDFRKIDNIILNRANLTIEKNKVVINNKRLGVSQFMNFAFYDIYNELNRLIQYDNKTEITKTLGLINGIKNDSYDNNSRLFKWLSIIDTNDNAQIFIIFREILIQFGIVVAEVVDKNFRNLDSSELYRKIDQIYIGETTEEEIHIRKELDNLFNSMNGINKSDLFKPLINICYKNIKLKLLEELKNLLTNKKTVVYQNSNYCRFIKRAKGV